MFEPLKRLLPEADVHPSIVALMSQGKDHQVLFWEVAEELTIPEHSHNAQWGYVVDGELALTTPGGERILRKGDWYFLEEGVPHKGECKAGFKEIVVFFQPDRYAMKANHQ